VAVREEVARDSEIRELEVALWADRSGDIATAGAGMTNLEVNQEIVRLDVAVGDVVGVHVRQARDKVLEGSPGSALLGIICHSGLTLPWTRPSLARSCCAQICWSRGCTS
jgi:hypothetical protein